MASLMMLHVTKKASLYMVSRMLLSAANIQRLTVLGKYVVLGRRQVTIIDFKNVKLTTAKITISIAKTRLASMFTGGEECL